MKKYRQLKLSFLATAFLIMFPMVAIAQTITNIVNDVGRIIGVATPVVVALALLYFFWGLGKFILAADNEQARTDGKQIMIWGIIILFVIVSIWALVQVLVATFGITPDQGPSIGPLVPGGFGGP